MLQEIRERAQGWIAWAIVILITIPFALWGIQSYLGVGNEPTVAKVNGTEITARSHEMRVEEMRMRLRERLGAAYRPELFDEQVLRSQVLDGMIKEQLLLQNSHDMGLRASNLEIQSAIVSNPAFQRDGRFDKATYERALQLQGISGPQYEDNLRQRLVGTQIQRALAISEFASDQELSTAVRLERQQRRLSYIVVPKADFLDDSAIPEEEVQTWYQDHADRFQTPERVKLAYLVLDAGSLKVGQPTDEKVLQDLYQEELDRFRHPEQRRARHVLVTVDAGADAAAEADAKTRIAAIRERLAAGEDFALVAREVSQDPGSATQGGDLGLFAKGVMDPAFEQAAFTLEVGQLSEPVRSQFGYHLIQVTEIQPETLQSFEEVREQLIAKARHSGAESTFYDLAERLANLVYETPDSLVPAAEALGLTVQSSDWITRDGGEGILANPKVLAAAYSDEVLRGGVNSDLIEPTPDALQVIVLRVTEHEEAAPRTLEAVRDDILASIHQQKAEEAAMAMAKGMVDRLQAGETMIALAGAYPITETGLVQRDDRSVPREVVNRAFIMPRPATAKGSYAHLASAQGDGLVLALTEVVDGDVATTQVATRNQASSQITQILGNDYYETLLDDMVARARIERNLKVERPGN